jgi:hypothetical protein
MEIIKIHMVKKKIRLFKKTVSSLLRFFAPTSFLEMKLPAASCGESERNCAIANPPLQSCGAINPPAHTKPLRRGEGRSSLQPRLCGISALLRQAAGHFGEGE